MCFWVFPKGSVDRPSLLSFWVACGDQIFDNSTIMIKSSDKSLQNTYRILRVLSNKDYLATDHEGGKYIFSQTKASLLANIPKTADHIPTKTPSSFLLHHIEILSIDNLQYAVFGVGNHDVTWAPLLRSKLLQSQKRVQKIFEQSILNLLKELIWMGGKAKQYLDMRNFWFVNEELCLLLIPRVRKNSNSLRKSQQVFQDKLSTIEAVIDAEKTLMKEFGLFLWQICFQQNFYQCLNSQKHLQVKQILQKIIGKVIQFEELVTVIKKKQISQQNVTKVRFKNKSKMDIFSRRKTTGSIEKSQNSSSNSLGISRMNTGFTENLKGARSIQKGTASSVQKSNQNTVFHRKFHIKQNRSMSQGDSLSNNASRNPHLAHPRLFQRHIGQQQSKNTIHYETWLQKKKYSFDMKQKLLRNSLVARQKYNQTILNTSDQKQIPKFEDSNFKDKILAKVIKFKSAFKSNYSTINRNEQVVQTQKQSQTIHLNQIPSKLIYNNENRLQNDEKDQRQLSLSLKREYNIGVPPNSTVTLINNQTISPSSLQQNYINRPKRAVQSNRKQYEQGRNSKYQRSKMVISSQREQDIQVVELRCQPNHLEQRQFKLQKNYQLESTNHLDLTKVKEIFNQYLLLINILGDITVRAVKIKDKLSQLNWRLITYFLYERFYFEREKLIYNMEKGQVIFRVYTAPPSSKQWNFFRKSEEYRQMFHKIKQQNVQILATLEKLGKKLLQEGELDQKIEHYLRNQRALSGRKNSKLRSQLCRFLAATIINQYEFVVEQAMDQELITRFFIDCTFGMIIICELEGMLHREHIPNVNNYKQYSQGLPGIAKWIDLIQKMLANSK